MPALILPNQVAFTPGRNIADQIILMREIMHSFSQTFFRTLAFCLKTDLSKAFDRMSWSFIKKALSLHSFLPTFQRWIMACVKSAKFTILFQGCALSPYIFIICMNILSALLLNELQQGKLKGLKLARSAPPLTNLMYANDLLLMGITDLTEVRCIKKTLDLFCQLSGQSFSPEKSKLWFSKVTPLARIRTTIRILRATFAGENETHLGSLVNASRASAFLPLLQKIDNKLHAWKARLLSPAGKIILMRSVLEAVLTYQMSTTLLPREILDKIRSKFVQFFWGKKGKKKGSVL